MRKPLLYSVLEGDEFVSVYERDLEMLWSKARETGETSEEKKEREEFNSKYSDRPVIVYKKGGSPWIGFLCVLTVSHLYISSGLYHFRWEAIERRDIDKVVLMGEMLS